MTSGITVVMAVRNGEATIRLTLESLLDQTLPPERIVVIDDGSTDATVEVAEAVGQRRPGTIMVRSQPNAGFAAALRGAVTFVDTEFVAIADADDWHVPQRLERSLSLMLESGADMVGGQVTGRLGGRLRLAPSRFPTAPSAIARRVSAGLDPLPHITMMVRRDGFDRFGSYRDLRRSADLELMLRWAHRGARLAVSPDVFAVYSFRPEFFSVEAQTRWMICTRYARAIAPLPDGDVQDFAQWFSRQRLGPPRREAVQRVARLTARLGVGMLQR